MKLIRAGVAIGIAALNACGGGYGGGVIDAYDPITGEVAGTVDDVGVNQVEFLVGATVIGFADVPPFTFTWNSTAVANGVVVLTARAIDAAGNVTASPVSSVTVAN